MLVNTELFREVGAYVEPILFKWFVLVLPRRGWSQLEPPATPGSAELQPSCGGLAGT